MAFLKHPFPEGNKMQILDNRYHIPPLHSFSKKIPRLIKFMLNADPIRRPNAKQIVDHINDILGGGKGTLRNSKSKRTRSVINTSTASVSQMKSRLHLPCVSSSENRRHSERIPVALLHNHASDDDRWSENDWDPFSDEVQNANNDNVSSDQQLASLAEEKINDIEEEKIVVGVNTVFTSDFERDFFGSVSAPIVIKSESKILEIERNVSLIKETEPEINSVSNHSQPKIEIEQKNVESEEKNEIVDGVNSGVLNKDILSVSSAGNENIMNEILDVVIDNRIADVCSEKMQQFSESNGKIGGICIVDSETESVESDKATAADPTVLYGDQLAQLLSMGFTNVEKNIDALVRGEGNIQIALTILV